LDEDDHYCPYCGEKQTENNSIVVQLPQDKGPEKVEEKSENLTKTLSEIDEKGLWDKRFKIFVIVFCVLSLLIVGILMISHWSPRSKENVINAERATVNDKSEVNTVSEKTVSKEGTSDIDSCTVSDEIDEEEINRRLTFLKSVYAIMFPSDSHNSNIYNPSYLQKYFTSSAMEKFYLECDYTEGDFSYCTDFMIDGNIASMRADYGYKVVQRQIEYMGDGWMLVSNYWDVIDDPAQICLKVEKEAGSYKISDIRDCYNEDN